MKTKKTIWEACPFCVSPEPELFLRFDETRSIVVCKTCRLARTSPAPGQNYTEQVDYFDFHLANEKHFRSYAKRQLGFVRKHAAEGRLLDIGCGVGFLLDDAKQLGYDVAGVELNKKAVSYCKAKGLEVRNCELSNCGFPDEAFDIITMNHVLEHVLALELFLLEVRRILKPGGIIALSQSCYRGLVPRILRRYWYGWVPEDHVWHFTPETLSLVLDKHLFEITDVQLNSMDHRFGLNIATLLCAPLLAKIGEHSSQGDQFYLVARKKE